MCTAAALGTPAVFQQLLSLLDQGLDALLQRACHVLYNSAQHMQWGHTSTGGATSAHAGQVEQPGQEWQINT